MKLYEVNRCTFTTHVLRRLVHFMISRAGSYRLI